MQGAFYRPDEPGASLGPAKTSGTATAALASGVLSFFCAYGVGGVLAITLGWIAHTEIEKSEGRLTGKGLANAGIGLGILNLVASVVAIGVFVAYAVRPDPIAFTTPPPPPVAVTPPIAAPPARPPAALPRVPSEEAEAPLPPLPALPAVIGEVSIIEASGEALEPLLRDQVEQGVKAGQRIVLWTVAPGCEPCAAVGRALPDARMQRALAGTRLVRADIAQSSAELLQLGVPLEAIPGFTLLDAKARPLDHIHGGEWGDDIPANIAPILNKFVRRTLSARRFPWIRPLREGETPL